MRSLAATMRQLNTLRALAPMPGGADEPSPLTRFEGFGSNPGALEAWSYVPTEPKGPLPLVVVLHGCTQNARAYDRGAGWGQLAQDHGFAVLLPEQQRANNPNLCFNWYDRNDNRRGAGEALSIAQMIESMIERHGIDPSRVYISGLSAGGAMASVMLAAYPDKFAGGAIIAGLPYGSASSIPEAFDRMRGHGGPTPSALGAAVRTASSHRGPWPSISVWHGGADHVVNVANSDAIVAQWCDVHHIDSQPTKSDTVDGYPHRLWEDETGRTLIEEYRITGMGHGTPLATGGAEGCGVSGAYMLEVAISSTRYSAAAWGLLRPEKIRMSNAVPTISHSPANSDTRPQSADTYHDLPAGSNVGKVINDALRAAGLMR